MAGQSKKRLNKITSDLVKIRKKFADLHYITNVRSHTDEKEINDATALLDHVITKLEYVEAL